MSNLPAAKEKLRKFGELFTTKKDIFAQVLPQHMRPERLIKVALMAMNRQPLLLQCTQASLFQALLAAASLGLEPDGVLGSAYLVPYRNNKTGQYEAQLIPGYRGLIDLARRSGQIESIEAHVIREGDKFECGFGLYPTLTHTPVFPGTAEYLDNKHIIGAYAVAKLKDGASQFEVMSRAEIDAIRNRSKAKDSGPWATVYRAIDCIGNRQPDRRRNRGYRSDRRRPGDSSRGVAGTGANPDGTSERTFSRETWKTTERGYSRGCRRCRFASDGD